VGEGTVSFKPKRNGHTGMGIMWKKRKKGMKLKGKVELAKYAKM